MIDLKRLKQLVDLMKNNELSELDIRDGEETISLKRPIASPSNGAMPASAPIAAAATPQAAASTRLVLLVFQIMVTRGNCLAD